MERMGFEVVAARATELDRRSFVQGMKLRLVAPGERTAAATVVFRNRMAAVAFLDEMLLAVGKGQLYSVGSSAQRFIDVEVWR